MQERGVRLLQAIRLNTNNAHILETVYCLVIMMHNWSVLERERKTERERESEGERELVWE